ncbi:REP element-mobilizing transposase RayT [Algoriphagus winogradskyi]|uniref:REP element-mobilizing transposase RayT n=2 Tax=Algoriphagus winogradskyi TaxID=237017 RepID=A0ABY1PA03_9BACT|nr:REP element-mobilizing transposase RayT [Algoriphagus winogradskyi]
MTYDPNFHHRRSVRLKGYDYSKAGLYFITICCYRRECFFGEILKRGKRQIMSLSKSGWVVQEGWFEIPLHYPEVVLHEFVVMPNHIHGIIEIVDSVGANKHSPNYHEGARANIDSPLQLPNTEFKSPSKTIGSIVRGYKIGVTKWHRANTDIYNVWQRSYHDHVIRNERSHANISNYILNNPSNWDDDMFYKS